MLLDIPTIQTDWYDIYAQWHEAWANTVDINNLNHRVTQSEKDRNDIMPYV